eukprot:4267012-Ditylum_brightwellii.AAC.1
MPCSSVDTAQTGLLVVSEVQMGCSVKGGDFKQAFFQSFIPLEEECLFMPFKTYLKLIRTLYGLKQSPKY